MDDSVVVVDSGPLIALATLGKLDLLKSLYSDVLLPAAVLREVVEAGTGRPGAADVAQAMWLQRVSLDRPPDTLLLQELGPGEAEVITVAVQRGGASVLLDERRARRIAEVVYGLKVRGTVGTLSTAKRRGLVIELRPLLESLQRSGYFIAPAIINRACREVGE
jgi:hypothetical protein